MLLLYAENLNLVWTDKHSIVSNILKLLEASRKARLSVNEGKIKMILMKSGYQGLECEEGRTI